MSRFPQPGDLHPLRFENGQAHSGTVFLQAAIDHPNLEIGRYTYHSSFDPPDDPADYAARLFPYLYPGAPEKVTIGSFCQIAHGVRFITSSANHRMDGISTYPFAIFDPDRIGGYAADLKQRRDTSVGHDCWLGDGCVLLPGAQLGNGVIVGAGAIVAGVVSDYAVVTGNRARIARMRFAESQIARLQQICWWNWPIETILAFETEIVEADVQALAGVAAGPNG